MSRKIPLDVRRQVTQRAGFRCEYCLLPEALAIYPFEVDHIIAIRHGGKSTLENLAYCCSRCNRNKGSDLTTFLTEEATIVRIFNPRLDIWKDHFEVANGVNLSKIEHWRSDH
jgi:5-methylcytosine-specific restriction endonuclease McrA